MIANPFRFIAFLYAFVVTALCAHALYCSYTIVPSPYNLQTILFVSLFLNCLFCIGLFRKYMESLKST